MSAPPYVKPGSSRRLELHTAHFGAATYHLSVQEIGELFQMLMAEAGMEPVAEASCEAVAEAFEARSQYRRIKGSFGREGLPFATRMAVFVRDSATCRYCRCELTWATYHCDHVVPVSKRGDSSMGNLAAACEACNRSKGAKLLAEWSGR